MCNIAWLKAGMRFKKDKFWNMVYNNPHGFGIILKDNGRLQVIREYHAENDPQKIWDLLEDNIDIERILHCRWQTDGDFTLDNVHPFPVISTSKREVWFAHNGVLHEYRGPTTELAKAEDPLSGASDSRRFVEFFLGPLMAKFKGENGVGDIHDPLFKSIVQKHWTSTGNRGILVSNNQDPLFLGGWEETTGENDVKIKVANTTYFDRVSRGPEYERREAAERQRKEEERAAQSNFSTVDLTKAGTINPKMVRQLASSEFMRVCGIPQSVPRIAEDPDFHTDDGYKALANLTSSELATWVEKCGADIVHPLSFILYRLRTAIEESEKLEDRLKKSSKIVEAYIKNYGKTVLNEVSSNGQGVLLLEPPKEKPAVEDPLRDLDMWDNDARVG